MSKAKGSSSKPAADALLALRLFDHSFPAASWAAWRSWLLGVLGLGSLMTAAEAETFRAGTGRASLPLAPCREVWTIAGRRSGKSRIAAFLLTFLAGAKRWKLAPGEKATVLIVTPSRRQGAVVPGYAESFIELTLPDVRITRRTLDQIDLSTGVSVQIQTASYRTPRGYTVVACICDEIAFWRSDDASANPDTEILRSIRPSLGSVPGSLLIALSSPYSSKGELFRTYERHYGREVDTLVWQSSTRTLNPTIPQGLIDQATEDDPASAAAEWLGAFRSDLETMFPRAALDACTARGRFELAPAPGVAYSGFLDPSGGSSDSFTLAIAHRDGSGRPVLDLVREVRPPFSPEAVCETFSTELRRYRISTAQSDAYAAQWPVEQFRKHGIEVQASPLTRSELYLELLPMVNSGGIELLDNARLLNQLSALQRRTGRSGRDTVDHPPNAHDDLGNAAAGALVAAVQGVGLKAPWPATFTECRNFDATAGQTCVLLSRGPRLPADGHCRRHCPGYGAAKAAYAAHQQAGGTLPLHAFLREHFEDNRLTGRFRDRYNEDWLSDAYF